MNAPTSPRLRVALYARVSTTRQADHDLSIPDQIKQMRLWAEQQGYLVVTEFIEPGATATDDKRPVFQRMIAQAMEKPSGFDVVIVHSLSRFFRDHIQSGVYERQLRKNGVSVVSITQPTPEDAAGEMLRAVIRLFDEHSSKETSKHTHRSMCENARQGFFNGSHAPFGYRTVTTDRQGARGRHKKQLEIEETEAAVVRDIYRLYLHGLNGKSMGLKEIAGHLTRTGQLMRGRPWRIQKVHDVLKSRAYLGEHIFNRRDSRTGKVRPPEEWIVVQSPPIIDALAYEQAAQIRSQRDPRKVPAGITASPNLLTGILKCACCGSAMTLATGKSGRYRYYKCSRRQGVSNDACANRRQLPMERFDDLILGHFSEVILQPERLNVLLAGLRRQVRDSREGEQERINEVSRQIRQVEERMSRLYDAVETGVMPLDDLLQKRVTQLRTARDALQVELANIKETATLPVERILASDVEQFAKRMRLKLKDREFAKRYLSLLVDKITVDQTTATLTGSYRKLTHTIVETKKMGTSDEVPIPMSHWRPQHESNVRPRP